MTHTVSLIERGRERETERETERGGRRQGQKYIERGRGNLL